MTTAARARIDSTGWPSKAAGNGVIGLVPSGGSSIVASVDDSLPDA